jgi:phage terminase large subunit
MMATIEAEISRRKIERQRAAWPGELERCREDPIHWFDTYVKAYDPRLVGTEAGPFSRLTLWPKQREMVRWIFDRMARREQGLVEKSRDVGATYITAGAALHQWLFTPGFAAAFGSRILADVDDKDNANTIFGKLRLMMRGLPPEMMPEGFDWRTHSTEGKLVNPATGAIIVGQGGENMGRGGRSTLYIVDEAAFIDAAEAVERSVLSNAGCVLWVSTVNGMANLFARKRHGGLGPQQIFRLHWRDDPRKDAAWAKAKEESYTDPTGWASEYEIDYTASIEGIAIPAAWVESGKELYRRLQVATLGAPASERTGRIPTAGGNQAIVGLDVGAGKAKSVAVVRRGPIVEPPKHRRDPDTTETAYWALDIARRAGASLLNFDSVGVGAGVQSTLMLAQAADATRVEGLEVQGVNTGIPASEDLVWPDGRTSKETFGNLKGEIWWIPRAALQRTHEHITTGREYPLSEMLALPSGDPESDLLCLQLSSVKRFRNEAGKIVMERKEQLAKRGQVSPDYAEALVLTYVPAPPVEVFFGLSKRNRS